MDTVRKNGMRSSDTNITGDCNGSRAAIPHMQKKAGVIFKFASVARTQWLGRFTHTASNTRYADLTATLAKELGKHNIRVVAIATTMIETPGNSRSNHK